MQCGGQEGVVGAGDAVCCVGCGGCNESGCSCVDEGGAKAAWVCGVAVVLLHTPRCGVKVAMSGL